MGLGRARDVSALAVWRGTAVGAAREVSPFGVAVVPLEVTDVTAIVSAQSADSSDAVACQRLRDGPAKIANRFISFCLSLVVVEPASPLLRTKRKHGVGLLLKLGPTSHDKKSC